MKGSFSLAHRCHVAIADCFDLEYPSFRCDFVESTEYILQKTENERRLALGCPCREPDNVCEKNRGVREHVSNLFRLQYFAILFGGGTVSSRMLAGLFQKELQAELLGT